MSIDFRNQKAKQKKQILLNVITFMNNLVRTTPADGYGLVWGALVAHTNIKVGELIQQKNSRTFF